MAIINNILTEIGDSIIIPTNIPIVGLISITGFIDSVLNETGTRFFKREFRYSLDTINWSTWIDLSIPNLISIQIDPMYDFMIEYKYTRDGTDASGTLVFNNVDLQGTYAPQNCGITFQSSVFAYFFSSCNSIPVLTWCISVMGKMYKPGIVSKTLIRDENQNQNNEDRDYIDFWRAVSCYFASLVAYAREFETFQLNRYLLIEYLKQRGMFVCDGMSTVDLNYLMVNFYDEIRQRGTIQITLPKETDINGEAKKVDGELLRMICFNYKHDEFIFTISEFDSAGWIVDSWSPLFQGTAHQDQLNKIYEKTQDVLDISKYPIIGNSSCSIIIDGSKSVLLIDNVSPGTKAGIGVANPMNLSPTDLDFLTNVSINVTYELSFYIKTSIPNTPISVRLYGYNINNLPEAIRDIKVSPLMPISNDAILEESIFPTNDYSFVRILIFPASHIYNTATEITTPEIGVGNNLKTTNNVCKIIPEIVLDNTNSSSMGSIHIWGIKFAPASTVYSTGFVGVSNFIQTWMQNNNGTYTNEQITVNMLKYLLPYKATLQNNFI